MGGVKPQSTARLLLHLSREQNADLRELNGDLRDDNSRLRQENARLSVALAGAQRMLEEVMADATAARRAAARCSVEAAAASAVTISSARSSKSACGPAPLATKVAASRIRPPGERSPRSGRQPSALAPPTNVPARRPQDAPARGARRAERAAAALRLQSQARILLSRQQARQHESETVAALRLQAIVRGNAARGIAERRKYDQPWPDVAY